MKNFEERLAEVQRRGEELRQKNQKLRRGILLSSISVGLCLVLFAAPFLPSRAPSGEAPEIGFDMMGSSGGNGTGVSVWVEDSQTSRSYSVHDEAKSVAALLQQITTVYEMTGAAVGKEDPASPTEEVCNTGTVDGKEELDGIIINAVLANGSARSYLLLDVALQDTETGKVYPMTAQQAQQLRQLLGIQEEKP